MQTNHAKIYFAELRKERGSQKQCSQNRWTSWMKRRRCKNTWPKRIGQVAQRAGELHKSVLVRPPTKLDDEAEIQAKSGQKVPSWIATK